ncbi:MAG: FAD-dependent oxidoreductase [Planctomycetota bacterium]
MGAQQLVAHGPQELVIVGGGLVGSLLALYLQRRGHRVSVYERRPDLRQGPMAAGRSINLVATERGLRGVDPLGLRSSILDLTVTIRGRTMHDRAGQLAHQPYGNDDREVNHSVPRAELNRLLISRAEAAGTRFYFGQRLERADLERRELHFTSETTGDTRTIVYEGPVIGADGAGSALRGELDRLAGHRSTYEPLGHSYKELEIPPNADGGYRLDPNALHIWPRGRHMMMALANQDGSFTVTLYLPDEGQNSFASLTTPAAVEAFFAAEFADSLPLLPRLTTDFFQNPTGRLGTLRAQPWHVEDRAVLIGDAAHAIVPFFGQGMNCGFEDCAVLDHLLDRFGGNWRTALAEYSEQRPVDGNAIADMALENFVEMRDYVGDPAFLRRKRVEHRLERMWPLEFRSRYAMVVYSSIPYHVVQELGRVQDGILDTLCAGIDSEDKVDLVAAQRMIRDRLAPLHQRYGIDLNHLGTLGTAPRERGVT